MSSTLTPRHGSWAPWVIHIFLVCALPSFLSSATMSLAVIYFLPLVACNAQSVRYHHSRQYLASHRSVSPLTGGLWIGRTKDYTDSPISSRKHEGSFRQPLASPVLF